MTPFAQAVDTFLTRLWAEARAQLEGLPNEDLNEWKPRQVAGDINTFYALAMHVIGAGEYWVLHAAAGWPIHRDRQAEFQARGDLASLQTRAERWLANAREALASLTEADFQRVFERRADPAQGLSAIRWTVAECLVHAVEHTALHVGHLQIQRQLWNAERGRERSAPAG